MRPVEELSFLISYAYEESVTAVHHSHTHTHTTLTLTHMHTHTVHTHTNTHSRTHTYTHSRAHTYTHLHTLTRKCSQQKFIADENTNTALVKP